MKIVIIGSNGQIGSDLKKVLEKDHELVCLEHKDIEITDEKSIEKLITIKPSIVINTAAYLDVQSCEENPKKAFEVNSIGLLYLAKICKKINAILLHLSTDYVFDGKKTKPYIEEDIPNPLNVYGTSKFLGELLIRLTTDKHLVVRTCSVFGQNPSRGKFGRPNFVDMIIKKAKNKEEIKAYDNVISTPINSFFLAKQIAEIIKLKDYGVYHAGGNTPISWHDFAKLILKLAKLDARLIKSKLENNDPIKKPLNTALENYKLNKLKINIIPPLEEALSLYLKEKGYI